MKRLMPVLFLAAAAAAQQVTIRDTIEALPPISFCQDGATHRTICTNQRLRPGAVGNLVPFEGVPVEITGTPGAITCAFVTVSSIAVQANAQFAVTTTTTTTMSLDFFGDGPAGDVYLLFIGLRLQAAPTMFPPFTGPVHLDPAGSWFVGLSVPQGATTPYHSLTFPFTPGLIGVDFFDQALTLHSSGAGETTVVDCFAF